MAGCAIDKPRLRRGRAGSERGHRTAIRHWLRTWVVFGLVMLTLATGNAHAAKAAASYKVDIEATPRSLRKLPPTEIAPIPKKDRP